MLGAIDDKILKDLADVIREHPNDRDPPYKPINMPEAVRSGYQAHYDEGRQKGHEAGYSEGYAQGDKDGHEIGYNNGLAKGFVDGKKAGLTEGIEQGKKAQEREWWDNYLDYGKRIDLSNAFGGLGWTVETFTPPYDLRPTSCYMMFRKTGITDLVAALERAGKVLDTSKATNLQYMFQSAGSITRIGVIDFTSCMHGICLLDNTLSYCTKLKIIEKVILINHNIQFNNSSFSDCLDLEELRFEGEIMSNGLNLQWSTKLSKASWVNIVGCYSTTISGLSMTGSLASVNKAFATSEGANDGSTSAEWLNLIATRPNVSFNLV